MENTALKRRCSKKEIGIDLSVLSASLALLLAFVEIDLALYIWFNAQPELGEVLSSANFTSRLEPSYEKVEAT